MRAVIRLDSGRDQRLADTPLAIAAPGESARFLRCKCRIIKIAQLGQARRQRLDFGDSIGIFGGYLVGVTRLGFNPAAYVQNTLDFLEFWDVGSGLVKGAAFGFIVALMGCYHGMNSARGAQGVGRATKSAVVSASVLILAANYVLTEVFFTS